MKHNLDLINYNYPTKQLEKYIHLFDSIDWYNISGNQKLSEEFIKKHIDKINIYWLMQNKKISEKIKQEIKTLKEII